MDNLLNFALSVIFTNIQQSVAAFSAMNNFVPSLPATSSLRWLLQPKNINLLTTIAYKRWSDSRSLFSRVHDSNVLKYVVTACDFS
uniref:Uncharacterized protein n=1 Tax=Glossina morsitans morsitans TaxID=37546 RepID=A0A1B0GCT0_GLOMM